jgi:hypothetical protein
MEYEEMMEKIKKSTQEHIKNAKKTKKKTPNIPVLKESELVFRDAAKMEVFLSANKQKYKYVGFCYARGHYVNFLHFTASLKEFDNLPNHTTIYCIVKLDKKLDSNYYIQVAKSALKRLKAENSHNIDCIIEKNKNIYEENYKSFKQFLIKEKVSQFEKQKDDIIKVAEDEIELL